MKFIEFAFNFALTINILFSVVAANKASEISGGKKDSDTNKNSTTSKNSSRNYSVNSNYKMQNANYSSNQNDLNYKQKFGNGNAAPNTKPINSIEPNQNNLYQIPQNTQNSEYPPTRPNNPITRPHSLENQKNTQAIPTVVISNSRVPEPRSIITRPVAAIKTAVSIFNTVITSVSTSTLVRTSTSVSTAVSTSVSTSILVRTSTSVFNAPPVLPPVLAPVLPPVFPPALPVVFPPALPVVLPPASGSPIKLYTSIITTLLASF
ncbi:hypothetical protein BB561_002260 [Smittium simulii]|uniref:Uncharacterized protein n=1 Tax=Smittium simulii TaxID=133385 RepID=A0A2T9YR30_9FUNG|nr:hypothetical protein BB561_002260 [Smittium simulii]